ncbi:hypothetical protein SNE40_010178 [Patella caerulea]
MDCDGPNEELMYHAKCDRRCGDPPNIQMSCRGTPRDMCVCSDNYYRKGTECVLKSQCGCEMSTQMKKFMINVNEVTLNIDCSQKVKCKSNGELVEVRKMPEDSARVCNLDNTRPELSCMDNYKLNKLTHICEEISTCTEGFKLFGGKCIYVSKEPVIWRTAVQDCNEHGGYLLQLKNADEIKKFQELRKLRAGGNFYVAGVNTNKQTSNVKFNEAGFENFKLPSNLNGSSVEANGFKCVQLSKSQEPTLTQCTMKKNYICEQKPKEIKTVTSDKCDGSDVSDGNEIESVQDIRADSPTCICTFPVDVDCQPQTGQPEATEGVCKARPSGELYSCMGDTTNVCSDYTVQGNCEKNIDECTEVGVDLCPSGTGCEDNWGSFSCHCSDVDAVLHDETCLPTETCEFSMPSESNTFEIIAFAGNEISQDVGDCSVTLVEDCDSQDSLYVKALKAKSGGLFVVTIKIKVANTVVSVTIDGGIEVNANIYSVGSKYADINIMKSDEQLLVSSIDGKLNVMVNTQSLVTMIKSAVGLCGSCDLSKEMDTSEAFSACSDPASGESNTGNPPPVGAESPTSADGGPPPPPPENTEPPSSESPTGPGPANPPNPETQPSQPVIPPNPTNPGTGPPAAPTTGVPNPSPGETPTPQILPPGTCDSTMSAASKCGVIIENDSPFKKCSNQQALYQLCLTKTCNDNMDFCDVLIETISVDCTNGILLSEDKADYMMQTGCVEECGPNMKFHFAPPQELPTCRNKYPNTANEGVAIKRDPQCICSPGFFLQNEGCIPLSECGCDDPNSERYYEINDEWLNADCTKLFVCKAGVIEERENTLIPNSQCGTKDNETAVVCMDGYLGDAKVECKKGEETDSSICATVQVEEDDVKLCLCKTGYVSDCDTCVDLDECQANLHDCKSNEQCKNLPGTFTCECKSGYKRNILNVCANINECQEESDTQRCPDNSKCQDLPGAFACSCCYGYTMTTASGPFQFKCQRNIRIPRSSSDCCICDTLKCRPPTDGSPAQVCGSDGITYSSYKQLYEVNCDKYGESNINVTIANYGKCPSNEPTTTTSTTTTTTTEAPTTQKIPCSSDEICEISEITSGKCCVSGKDYSSLCDLRMHICLGTGKNPEELPIYTLQECNPPTTTTTTQAPTPAESDFEPWSSWSDCKPQPGGLDCGMGVKERTRGYNGPNPELLTSESTREMDSCDLPPCSTDTVLPPIPNECDFSDCPKVSEPFCGRVINVDDLPKTYSSRCHLERTALCKKQKVSYHPNEYYPAACAPGGKRPSTLPCSKGPFTQTYKYSSSSGQTECSSDVISISLCDEGYCNGGTNVCCRPDKVEYKKINVSCQGANGLSLNIPKEVMSVLTCVCGDKDA